MSSQSSPDSTLPRRSSMSYILSSKTEQGATTDLAQIDRPHYDTAAAAALSPLCRDPLHAPYQYHTFENLEAPRPAVSSTSVTTVATSSSDGGGEEQRWGQMMRGGGHMATMRRREPIVTVLVCLVLLFGLLYLMGRALRAYWICGNMIGRC